MQLNGSVTGLRIVHPSELDYFHIVDVDNKLRCATPKQTHLRYNNLDVACAFTGLRITRNLVDWREHTRNGVLLIDRPFRWYDAMHWLVKANRFCDQCAFRLAMCNSAQAANFKSSAHLEHICSTKVIIFPKPDQGFSIRRKRHDIYVHFRTGSRMVLDVSHVSQSTPLFPVIIFGGSVTAMELVSIDSGRSSP